VAPSRSGTKSARAPLDRYDTPLWMVEALLRHVPEIGGGTLLDPCCGGSSMAWRLAGRFDRVVLNDIDPQVPTVSHYDISRSCYIWAGSDADWVITNPPFSLSGRVINRALHYSRRGVALLMRISALEVCAGREILGIDPPHRLIVLPRFKFRDRGTDSVTVGWFVWSRQERFTGPPIVLVSRPEAQRLQLLCSPEPAAFLLPRVAA
jgi:hypothetical protein